MIDFTTGRLWSNVLSLGASDVDSTPATPEEKEVENTPNTTVNSFQSQQQEKKPTVKTETVQKNEMETQEKTESKPSDAKVPTAQPQQDKQPVSPAPESAQAPSDKAVYYTIQRGDTLYGIAKKHGTTVQKICQLNNITEDTKIKADDKIRVK
ncbi:MAG: LysM peptidoglycan-binding domain-containing protein [Bacteroidales bacterium]|nr:LysM peptidoglycan-binding domain-containing protein [Bacteroidales bacterium]